MVIISNVEFEKLTDGQSSRLKTIAKARADADPSGFLTVDETQDYIKACVYSGDNSAAQWLKNLIVLSANGTIKRVRSGQTTWEDHCTDVRIRYAAKEIPFDIGQHVFCKDCGRYGSIADYIPDSKEYLVVLDPFQVRQYKKSELEKVAKQVTKAETTAHVHKAFDESDFVKTVVQFAERRGIDLGMLSEFTVDVHDGEVAGEFTLDGETYTFDDDVLFEGNYTGSPAAQAFFTVLYDVYSTLDARDMSLADM